MAEKTNFSWREGEAATLTFTPTAATDITGWTLRLTVRAQWNGADVWTKTIGDGLTVVSASTGVIRAEFTSADTDGAEGIYLYDLKRLDSGAEAVLAYGAIEILPSTF